MKNQIIYILFLLVCLFLSCNSDSKTFFNKAILLENEGKYIEAINELEKSIELNPKNYLAYLNLGADYSTIGKYDMSIQYYEKAITIDSFIIAPYLNIGRNLGRLNKPKESKVFFEKCLNKYKFEHYKLSQNREFATKLRPTYDELLFALAVSNSQLNNYSEALNQLYFLKNKESSLPLLCCQICYCESKADVYELNCECCKQCPNSEVLKMDSTIQKNIKLKCND